MKQYCIVLSFGADEVQSISVVILNSYRHFSNDEDAMRDLTTNLLRKYKEEKRTSVFTEWFATLSDEEQAEVRKNYREVRKNHQVHVSVDEFKLWLTNIPRCSFSGIDGFGEISGWYFDTGIKHLINSGYSILEFSESAELAILQRLENKNDIL